MAVSKIEAKNFLVFKGEFSLEFHPGVNVLIGSNGTGKTTLLKMMYALCESTKGYKIFSEFFSVVKDIVYDNPFKVRMYVEDFFVERNYQYCPATL